MYMNDGNKTKINLRNKSVFITGVAGFIGSNLAKRLLSTVEGVKVVGLDNMNHYYDVRLKEARLNELEQFDNFSFVKGNLADKAVIESIFEQYKPEIVVNLGAQAGVRYSITNPDAYVEANLIGFYNILEACRHSYDEGHTPVEHLVYASSSSVYGSNKKVPYSTDDKVDNPVSLYAATKKSNELMAHAYSKLYNIPSTGLRFFTVYGPAGRPDMAYFGFTNKLLKGETIQIFNYGNCKRDFTYVDDIVEGVVRVMQGAPERKNGEDGLPVPPYAVYNIGNQNPENLLDFVQILQEELIRAGVLPEDYDFEAHKKLVPMQPGDVPVTYADTYVINNKPNGTNINNNAGSTHIEGLQKFVVEKGLDVGFAFDGDADRCLCVDEKGNVITGDHILYIYGCYMKERGKLLTNTVVTTVMSNFGLYKAFDEQGIGYAKTAVGDKYVYEYMAKNGCRIGGEQSGHIIFSKYASTGDGMAIRSTARRIPKWSSSWWTTIIRSTTSALSMPLPRRWFVYEVPMRLN